MHDATGTRDGACLLHALGECDGPSEMNEHPSRAKTRGLPPSQRFNMAICHRLCAKHHRSGRSNFTSRTLRLVPQVKRFGFDGSVLAIFSDGRRVLFDADRNIVYIKAAK